MEATPPKTWCTNILSHEGVVPLSYSENNCNLGISDNRPNNNNGKTLWGANKMFGFDAKTRQHQRNDPGSNKTSFPPTM